MCDTLIFINEAGCYLAKNSDREPDEAQLVEWHKAGEQVFASNGLLKTTYISVAAPKERYGYWLSRPQWMWGGEMGVNEHGIAIGNEAVFTRLISKNASGLLGMDIVRLALEQSKTAERALRVITLYIEKYGQGGNASATPGNKLFYDNSFLIADKFGAWQLETAGTTWAAKKITLDDKQAAFGAISNGLSITTDFDQASDHIRDKAGFNFEKHFATKFMPWAARAKQRKACALAELEQIDQNQAIAPQLANILRQHKKGDKHSSNADICMHATSVFRPSQTTQSMITFLPIKPANGTKMKVWMTGSSATCISLFKPVFVDDNWIANKPFWLDWQKIYQCCEQDKDFKQALLTLNHSVEEKLWLQPDDSSKLLDDWWQAVKIGIRAK